MAAALNLTHRLTQLDSQIRFNKKSIQKVNKEVEKLWLQERLLRLRHDRLVHIGQNLNSKHWNQWLKELQKTKSSGTKLASTSATRPTWTAVLSIDPSSQESAKESGRLRRTSKWESASRCTVATGSQSHRFSDDKANVRARMLSGRISRWGNATVISCRRTLCRKSGVLRKKLNFGS